MYAIGFLAMLAAVKTGEIIVHLCLQERNVIVYESIHLTIYDLMYVAFLYPTHRNGNASKGTKPLFTPWSLP